MIHENSFVETSDLSENSSSDDFLQWNHDLIFKGINRKFRTEKGKIVLQKLEQELGKYHTTYFLSIRNKVVICLYNALHYKKFGDVYHKKRGQNREFLKNKNNQIKAIKLLQKCIKESPEESNAAFIEGYVTNRKDNEAYFKLTNDMLPNYAARWLNEVLGVYLEGLSHNIWGIDYDLQRHLVVAGNMLYPEEHRRVNWPSISTMLQFELGIRFRYWTNHEWSDDSPESLDKALLINLKQPTMPDFGWPCYGLIADIINLFDLHEKEQLDQNKVQNTLKHIPKKIKLSRWRHKGII